MAPRGSSEEPDSKESRRKRKLDDDGSPESRAKRSRPNEPEKQVVLDTTEVKKTLKELLAAAVEMFRLLSNSKKVSNTILDSCKKPLDELVRMMQLLDNTKCKVVVTGIRGEGKSHRINKRALLAL